MELTFIKNYLRIDTDFDDEYIKLLIDVAREYVTDAVGECDETKARVKLVMLNLIATLYENRQFTIDKSNEKVAYAIKTMLLQLGLGGEAE